MNASFCLKGLELEKFVLTFKCDLKGFYHNYVTQLHILCKNNFSRPIKQRCVA